MNSESLTDAQIEELKSKVAGFSSYVGKLRVRMEKRGFPYDDQLRQRVEWASSAVHSLWVCLHYLSCKGAGRIPKADVQLPAGYRVSVELSEHAPIPPVASLPLIDAESPLEAIVKIARSGQLPAGDRCWARVVLAVGEDGRAAKVVTVRLDRELLGP